MNIKQKFRRPILVLALCLVTAACGSDASTDADEATSTTIPGTTTTTASTAPTTTTEASDPSTTTFRAEVWADNWFALYANGELVGEDSVPITTERSFNAETIEFEAAYPLTIAIEAKDFIETDSGLEYIGQANQQMGDGGIIVQITDESTGAVVAVTDGSWSALVIHQAPLNVDCVDDADPDATCEFAIVDVSGDWANPDFDDSAWTTATEWSAAAVDPKGGYSDIDWDSAAEFVWGSDLEVDNTVLLRLTVAAG